VMWHVWGKYYVTGNVNSKYSAVTNDNWTYGMYNQIDNSKCDYTYTQATKDTMRIEEPIPFVSVTTHTAEQAYEKVLQYVGASLHRDALDDIIISDTRTGTATFTGSGNDPGFINSQSDVASKIPTLWPELNSITAPVDSDGDGMPDEWETANGLNPSDASDGNITDAEGYTNLERYMNSLVADITARQNEGGEQQGYIEEVYVPGEETGFSTLGTGSVDWLFNTGAAGQKATSEAAISSYIANCDVALGSNLSFGGTQNINNGSRLTKIKSSINNEATANEANALSFNVTMNDGYYFRPTNIAFLACRCGTNGGKVDVCWKNDSGKSEIELGFTPERNNDFSTYSKDINDIASATGTNSLLFHIYSLGSGKAIAIGNVAITGEVKTPEENGISETRNTTFSSKTYTLHGTEVNHPSKGIYIKNGKKLLK